MKPPPNLVDSSFLYSLFASSDPNHEEAQAFAELVGGPLIILNIILVEAAFLFRRRGGVPAVSAFMDGLYRSDLTHDTITRDDLPPAQAIMERYAEAALDFVDVCLMAYAERNNIRRICTYDHRDFGLVKPDHAPSFILLPLEYDKI